MSPAAPDPIRLARNLALPLEAVTETFAIIGNRGKGKSTTVTTFVEQLYKANLQTVVIDIKGDHWGIRSSRDGKGPGLPFVIFGGDHGDVPLEPTAGAIIADAVVDYQISAILDLSRMSKTKARSFTTAFAERLYERNRDPLMVVVDEADVLIPQRADAETARLIGAMEDIAKRGRGRGLGMIIATQRGQEVNKSVLDIMENVILLGITGRLTIKAIREWIMVNADEDSTSARDVIGSLPSMSVGEAWVWSPAFLRIVQRVKINLFTTFDSHATPKPGESRIVPVKRAEIDLAKLGAEISATVERAKAIDPKTLQAQLAAITQVAANREQEIVSLTERLDAALAVEARTVEVPARLPEELLASLRTATQTAEDALIAAQVASEAAHDAGLLAVRIVSESAAERPALPKPTVADLLASTRSPHPAKRPSTGPIRRPVPTVRPTDVNNQRADALAAASHGESDPSLGKAERAVLSAIAPYAPNARSAKQIALISQYSSKGGGFRNALGSLRSKGYIVGGNSAMTITPDGQTALGEYDPLPTGAALVEHWCNSSVLGRAEVACLRAIVDAYPHAITSIEVASEAGYEPGGGGFRNALGKLRSLELIVGGNASMMASEELIDP